MNSEGSGESQGSKVQPGKSGQNGGDAGMTPEQAREAMARRAEKLAETGKTLQDILNAVSQSNDPADKDATSGCK